MEPISIIVAALVAGAAKAASEVAPDAYLGLKALIKRKFAGKPTAEMLLAEHEQDPETYEAPLKKKLAEAGADRDQEIVKQAEKVLEQIQPQAADSKYNIVFQGESKGNAFGDRNSVTNTFGS
ncbi:hypothetical protein IQ255_14635 [Pleurocapsales cyanobacterium LEGE 10410]|nr:hypothetical protein [Pleurocapsales cyanobacterium LEGE 10410]